MIQGDNGGEGLGRRLYSSRHSEAEVLTMSETK